MIGLKILVNVSKELAAYIFGVKVVQFEDCIDFENAPNFR
jgi:hypothetical protein